MRSDRIAFAVCAAWSTIAAPAFAQHEGHDVAAATASGASAQLVTQCVDSQRQSLGLVDAANARLESARQSNSPAEIRAAMADLQRGFLDIRTVLARCTELQQALAAAPPPAPSAAATAVAPADPHAGHVMPAAPSTAADSHAGHVMPAAPSTAAAPATAHAGHAAPQAQTATGKAPVAVGTASAKGDAHAAHATSAGDTTSAAAQAAVDPVCGLTVNPADAPSASHQGRTFYFCSLQHQRSFLKEPPKYISKTQK